MSEESHILDLLEEVLESKRTPEEVCANEPELLDEIKRRLNKFHLVDAQVEELFPSTGPAGASKSKHPTRLLTELPAIPGYNVTAILGRGGMGVVYKATHLKLHRTVAIKMLLSGEYASAIDLTHFMREAEAIASLRHPHIVQVHDVGDFEGRAFYTMEFVEGGTLAQKLAGVPQPAREAAALVATLAEAVQAAHSASIIHRDLKPANILLTNDSIPKITDFGLARRFEGEPSYTLSGARVGTPSYMSPEQAGGTADAFSPFVDIYSLGAILYETLTGRPPFQAETASETERQVIEQDPVPPSRLNVKVPRDLETICLKCLQKNPARRYPTAAALAEDLHRFLRGEPISARPISFLERAFKWARRRPAITAALLATLLLSIVLTGGIVWFNMQQAQRRQAVENDLRDMANLQEQAQWLDARAALDRAEARLNGGGSSELLHRLAQARADLALVMHLNDIRLNRVTNGTLIFYRTQANKDYEQAFRDAALAAPNDPAEIVAQRVKASAVHKALVEALDNWAVAAILPDQRSRLLTIAKSADPDPSGWRERIRNPAIWKDRAALSQLAEIVPTHGQPVGPLLTLAERLRALNGDATPLLFRIQKEYPADFWANLDLGNALFSKSPAQSEAYFRAALAARPGAAVGYTVVGDSLRLQHLPNEALDYYQKALAIEPRNARAEANLGDAFRDIGRTDDAVTAYNQALAFDPHYVWADYELANVLKDRGQLDDAIARYQIVVDAKTNDPKIGKLFRTAIIQRGRFDDAWSSWHSDLEPNANPALPSYEAYAGYAELSLYLSHPDEYQRMCQLLPTRFGTSKEPAMLEGIARTLVLIPPSPQNLQTACTLIDSALTFKDSEPAWAQAYLYFAQGLIAYRQNNFDQTISLMTTQANKVMGPCPRLLLAMAQERQGNHAQAQRTLTAAIHSWNWSPAKATDQTPWICHILRREAESLITQPSPTTAPNPSAPSL